MHTLADTIAAPARFVETNSRAADIAAGVAATQGPRGDFLRTCRGAAHGR